MTFEEFFTKKKIDLKALKAADEPLFEEFRAHYSAMGEKSFDHSKKFWFNKLRKNYHLVEEEALLIKKLVQTDLVETTPATPDTTAAKPAGFKPRFKATAPAEPTDQKEEAKTTPSTVSSNSSAGFKPRFKPGITKSTDTSDETSASVSSSTGSTSETAKPTGFKPRFKPGVTNSATSKADSSGSVTPEERTTAEPSKPAGFKPRFEAGVTKTENTDTTQTKAPSTADTSAKQVTEPAPEAAPSLPESDATNPPPAEQQQNDNIAQEQPVANKPTGFKPRFKAGLTKIDKKEE